MICPTTTLSTIGVIAQRLNQPVWRIEYLIRSRNIQPTSRAGNARVFTEKDVNRISQALHDIDSSKGGSSCD